MQHRSLSPVGAEITGVALGEVSPETVVHLRRLLANDGVLILRGQEGDDVDFAAFLRRFGPLQFTKGEVALEGFPDLNVITNVGRRHPPRSVFHSDTSYVRRPPAYTALRAVTVPDRGGQTLFTNQYRAYETLPQDIRAALRDRTITHVVTGLALPPREETTAEHPVFRRHPISGRTALYLSTPERCVAISGIAERRAREVIAFLHGHSTASHNVYRHDWRGGDVVMWDNRCVLHRADHTDVVGDRVLHRGLVADPVPGHSVAS